MSINDMWINLKLIQAHKLYKKKLIRFSIYQYNNESTMHAHIQL